MKNVAKVFSWEDDGAFSAFMTKSLKIIISNLNPGCVFVKTDRGGTVDHAPQRETPPLPWFSIRGPISCYLSICSRSTLMNYVLPSGGRGVS